MHRHFFTTHQLSSTVMSDRSGAAGLIIGIFFLIITVAAYGGIFLLNKSQQDVQNQMVEQVRRKEDDLRPKVLDQIFMLQKKLKMTSGIISSHIFTQHTLTLLERDTHPRVIFESYTFSPKDNDIVLKGKTDDYGTLAQQIAFLEGDQNVDKVEFGGLSLGSDNRVSFGLTIHIVPSLVASPPK